MISYYLNYLSENQLTMEDVWNMKYEKQQEHFTDFLIWLKAGMEYKVRNRSLSQENEELRGQIEELKVQVEKLKSRIKKKELSMLKKL